MATRSIPMVSNRPRASATMAFVPTPSVPATSTGWSYRAGVEGEEASEVAQTPQHLVAVGRRHQRLDQFDGPLTGVDVDTGAGVGGRRGTGDGTARALARVGCGPGHAGSPATPLKAAGSEKCTGTGTG